MSNIYIAHHVNYLSVLSYSSIQDWLSGHLHKSLIAICIKLSFWCECTPHLTIILHGQRGGETMGGTCLRHAIHNLSLDNVKVGV